MPFASDILGHAAQVAMLSQALEQGRLHHAYVFIGPEGVGKRALAYGLAKAIHCGEAAHDYCGGCASCVKIDKLNHPDVRMVELVGLHATRTASAVIVRRFSAVNRLREAVRERALADALRPDKNVRVVKPVLLERLAQHRDLRGVVENVGSKGHRFSYNAMSKGRFDDRADFRVEILDRALRVEQPDPLGIFARKLQKAAPYPVVKLALLSLEAVLAAAARFLRHHSRRRPRKSQLGRTIE